MVTVALKVPYSYLDQEYLAHRDSIEIVINKIRDCVSRGWFTIGPYIQEFEEAFAKVAGYRYAVACNSGTDALVLAMRTAGVGPGHEVWTTPNTFMATVGAILETGARARLVDVGPDYLMDIDGVLRDCSAVIPNAVIPVALTGRPLPAVQSSKLSAKYPDKIIIDAAQAIGCNPTGTGHLGCYSLHPLKNVHCWGDGGVVCTNSPIYADDLRLLRNHGSPDRNTVLMPGYNSRLDTIQALAALESLSRMDWVTKRRNANARFYDETLSVITQIVLPPRDPSILEAFHTYVIQVDHRTALIEYLNNWGIETKIHYPIPLHLQPGFAQLGYKRGDFPVAESQAERILSLPIHEYLTEAQLTHVCDSIRQFYKDKEWISEG